MAEAIIARRDLRYSGEVGLQDLEAPYKKASWKSGANNISLGNTYYPLGDATTTCTKEGFLYITATCTGPAAAHRFRYTVTIGNDTYTSDGSEKYRYRFTQIFKIPIGVTVSFTVSSSGSASTKKLAAAMTAL